MLDAITGRETFVIAMWGMVISLWIALLGMFAIALLRDGQSVPIVVDAAVKLVGATVICLTTMGSVHIVINRPPRRGVPTSPKGRKRTPPAVSAPSEPAA